MKDLHALIDLTSLPKLFGKTYMCEHAYVRPRSYADMTCEDFDLSESCFFP